MNNNQSQTSSAQDHELTQEQLDQVTGGASDIQITKPTDTTSPK